MNRKFKATMMSIEKPLLYLAAAFLLAGSQIVNAQLIVNRSIIMFESPGQNREDVVVLNNSKEDNLYVQVDPFTVLNPGSSDQELVPMVVNDNPEFLVTPNRLVTPPGGRSIVRFLNLKPAEDRERVYRVNMIPITPPAELDDENEDVIKSRLEVVVAYQVLVIVLPANPEPVMTMDRQARNVVFMNEGNANYLLTDGQQCDPATPTECVPLEDRRIYPGNEWRYELPFDGPFTYKVRTQTGLTTEYFR